MLRVRVVNSSCMITVSEVIVSTGTRFLQQGNVFPMCFDEIRVNLRFISIENAYM